MQLSLVLMHIHNEVSTGGLEFSLWPEKVFSSGKIPRGMGPQVCLGCWHKGFGGFGLCDPCPRATWIMHRLAAWVGLPSTRPGQLRGWLEHDLDFQVSCELFVLNYPTCPRSSSPPEDALTNHYCQGIQLRRLPAMEYAQFRSCLSSIGPSHSPSRRQESVNGRA